MAMIKIQVDGEEVQADSGSTLLEVLESLGKSIPVICYHDATTSEGICRQCVVEVEGWRVLAASCVTKVSDGMVIHTNSERVARSRKTILEMLAASTDLTQADDIQDQIESFGADVNRFQGEHRFDEPAIDDNPFFVRDYAKCILCWRCVQACGDDAQFTYAISIGGRGYDTKIMTAFNAPLPETTCVFCGNCIGVCPTGALRSKTEFFLEQGKDYDAIRREKRKSKKKQRKAD